MFPLIFALALVSAKPHKHVAPAKPVPVATSTIVPVVTATHTAGSLTLSEPHRKVDVMFRGKVLHLEVGARPEMFSILTLGLLMLNDSHIDALLRAFNVSLLDQDRNVIWK